MGWSGSSQLCVFKPYYPPILLPLPNVNDFHLLLSDSGSENVYREGVEKKTGGRQDILCNDYSSTMRVATDKRSSSVEMVDQVAKG